MEVWVKSGRDSSQWFLPWVFLLRSLALSESLSGLNSVPFSSVGKACHLLFLLLLFGSSLLTSTWRGGGLLWASWLGVPLLPLGSEPLPAQMPAWLGTLSLL